MHPSPRKRALADFFKPYARTEISTASTIPQKRPSPGDKDDDDQEIVSRRFQVKEISPIRDSNLARLDNGARSTPRKRTTRSSPPRSGTSVSIPIRTPKSQHTADVARTYKQGTLFERSTRVEKPLSKPTTSFSFKDIPHTTRSVEDLDDAISIRDSEDDDSSSLASLGDLFGRRQSEGATSSSSPLGSDTIQVLPAKPKSNVTFFRGKSEPLVGKEKLRELNAIQRAQRFDISDLLGDHFDDEEVEANVNKTRAGYEASTKEVESGRQVDLDTGLLASLVQDDNDDEDVDFSRLMNAVDRTDALASDKTFSFFGSNPSKDRIKAWSTKHQMPESVRDFVPWHWGDDAARNRAFLSGCMSNIKTQPPDELMKWTFHSVLFEQREDLRSSYIDLLRTWGVLWTRNNISAEDVQTVFQRLGADPSNMRDGTSIEPKYQPLRLRAKPNSKALLATLDLFQVICSDMDFLALSKLSSMTLRLALDAEVMSYCDISAKVETLLQSLLNLPDHESRSHVAERILLDASQNLHDPTLQARLLTQIWPVSTLSTNLRISLAHIFLLGEDSSQTNLLSTPKISLDRLTNYVSTSPNFDTQRRNSKPSLSSSPVDYVALKHRTHLLDIAVSDGGRPTTFSSRADEKQFNRSVDALADHIRTIFVSIADTGASHMRRTEAKDVLQAFHSRLLFCVRTEVRPKKHIFDIMGNKAVKGGKLQLRDGEEVRAEERGKNFMADFLAKKNGRLNSMISHVEAGEPK